MISELPLAQQKEAGDRVLTALIARRNGDLQGANAVLADMDPQAVVDVLMILIDGFGTLAYGSDGHLDRLRELRAVVETLEPGQAQQ